MINKFIKMSAFKGFGWSCSWLPLAQSASAFALLGPFAPWMVAPLVYQLPNAIGGPMLMGEGYRWNVPVITYGFDQSFLDFFGTNGVAAVDGAIQILNDLPPASQIVLTNYPFSVTRPNANAEGEGLLHLKSHALALLLEQMGHLAKPIASMFCIRSFTLDVTNNSLSNYSLEIRNFDPVSLQPSTVENNTACGYSLFNISFPLYGAPQGEVFALAFAMNLNSLLATSVADTEPSIGSFYSGDVEIGHFFSGLSLTRDDVGGLAYLYSTNNIALENLLPDVRGYGANATNFVGNALRPGVDKITFQQMNYLSPTVHTFATVTNQYVDTYITNGVAQQQTLERVLTQPDILFTAKYIGANTVSRTGTTNWVNNGIIGHDGPGVIQPPVVINFNRLGPSIQFQGGNYPSSSGGFPVFPVWGSFDGTTNAPIAFPVASLSTNATEFHFLLYQPNQYLQPPTDFTWNLPGQPNSLVSLQTSTNLSDWLTFATITNQGGTFTYEDMVYTNSPQRYFRTVPQ